MMSIRKVAHTKPVIWVPLRRCLAAIPPYAPCRRSPGELRVRSRRRLAKVTERQETPRWREPDLVGKRLPRSSEIDGAANVLAEGLHAPPYQISGGRATDVLSRQGN
jgi:hypothetical protein